MISDQPSDLIGAAFFHRVHIVEEPWLIGGMRDVGELVGQHLEIGARRGHEVDRVIDGGGPFADGFERSAGDPIVANEYIGMAHDRLGQERKASR